MHLSNRIISMSAIARKMFIGNRYLTIELILLLLMLDRLSSESHVCFNNKNIKKINRIKSICIKKMKKWSSLGLVMLINRWIEDNTQRLWQLMRCNLHFKIDEQTFHDMYCSCDALNFIIRWTQWWLLLLLARGRENLYPTCEQYPTRLVMAGRISRWTAALVVLIISFFSLSLAGLFFLYTHIYIQLVVDNHHSNDD